MDSVRMDKWLWAARFFKTRSLAADSCDMGRVFSNEHAAKAARDVRVGDKLRIKSEGGVFEVEVLALSSVRGPAAAAQALYRESEESKAARVKMAEERRMMAEFEGAGGRPNKKDRRDIRKARGRIISF